MKTRANLQLPGLSAGETLDLFPGKMILLGYAGSVAHGTYEPGVTDDKDVLGVAFGERSCYLGLSRWEGDQKKRGEWDIVIYEIRKYVHLLLKSNPNVMSLLWLPENLLLIETGEGQELRANRELFVSKRIYHSFTGYAYGQLKRMTHFGDERFKTAYMGEKRKALVEQHGYDCYSDEDTEFLTERGWVRYDDVSQLDRIGTVNQETGQFEFQHYLGRTEREYTGELIEVAPQTSRAVVTPTHNLWVSPAHRSKTNGYDARYVPTLARWRLQGADRTLAGRRSVYHVRTTPEPRDRPFAVEKDYLVLLGLQVSDGTISFRDGNVRYARLAKKKKGRFAVLADLAAERFGGRKYAYEKETIWTFSGETARRLYQDVGHGSRLKRLPRWTLFLSTEQAQTLWETLLAGDGYRGEKTEVYYTSSPGLAGDIQAMLVTAGLPSVVGGPYINETTFGTVPMYQVRRSLVGMPRIRQWYATDARVDRIPVRRSRVVCFSVPNGLLLTRSHGKTAIHGNCKNAAHLIRLLRMGIEFLNEGVLHVQREDAPQLLQIKHGEWSLEKVQEEAERLFRRAEEAYDRCTLPAEPNREAVERLLMRMVERGLRWGNE